MAEKVLIFLLDLFVSEESPIYLFILYFGIVAFSEEGAKYLFLKIRTWKNPEFNCRYDGIVYAIFVSLGFALWENISYVMHYGFSTALVRAVTAIPGHACFGVFMGIFYGIAKAEERGGNESRSATNRTLALIVPALLHGAYDYIASADVSPWYFVVFVAGLFLTSFVLVGRNSRKDQKI